MNARLPLHVPLAALAALALVRAPASAQPVPADTAVVPLPGIEVTALRDRDSLASVPAAAFVLTHETVARAGSPRLSALLGDVPGLFAWGQASGADPLVVDPRGFTANGERSYLRLLVDGQDVRDLENGAVDWDWIAPGTIERVEVVQGPGAWVRGDASEGGIVNVVRTPIGDAFTTRADGRAGSFGLGAGSVTVAGPAGSARASATGFGRHVDGWRANSRERVWGGDGRATAAWGGRELRLDLSGLDSDRRDPGYLDEATFATDPSRAATDTDRLRAQRGRGVVRLQSAAGAAPAWAIEGYGRLERGDEVRTLFFQPLSHGTHGGTGGGTLEWRGRGAAFGRALALTATAEAERATLRSDYRFYDPATRGATGSPIADARSTRTSGAVSLDARLELGAHAILRASARGDVARVRSRDELASTGAPARTMRAFSPLLGLNVRAGGATDVFASASTAFRVPSLYQMFDQRPIFNGSEFVTISNGELDPQRTRSVEAGARWSRGAASAQLAAYSTYVRDEIDFDLATLRYANVSRSWHRGIELALVAPLPARFVLHAGGAYTPTAFDAGDAEGRQINSVPLGTGSASLVWAPFSALSARVGSRLVGRQYLDKGERVPLGSVVAWDAGLDARAGRMRAALRLTNLFDRSYAESGYEDPLAGAQLLPAAPRAVSVAVSWE